MKCQRGQILKKWFHFIKKQFIKTAERERLHIYVVLKDEDPNEGKEYFGKNPTKQKCGSRKRQGPPPCK